MIVVVDDSNYVADFTRRSVEADWHEQGAGARAAGVHARRLLVLPRQPLRTPLISFLPILEIIFVSLRKLNIVSLLFVVAHKVVSFQYGDCVKGSPGEKSGANPCVNMHLTMLSPVKRFIASTHVKLGFNARPAIDICRWATHFLFT